MSPDVVYLARHGQTEWNLQRRWQGQLDSPLTEQGWQTASALARFVVEHEIDAVFSSVLGRARSTAGLAADAIGVRLRALPDLAEVNHGQMGGMTPEEADHAFPGVRVSREADKHRWRFPAGESYADADERAARAVREVRRSGCHRPVIVSHEMIGRMLLRQVAHQAPHDTLGLQQPHHVVYRVDPAAGAISRLSTS